MDGWSLHWQSQPDLAVGRAEELYPHLNLVDDEPSGESLTPLVRELGGRVADAKIVLLIEPDARQLPAQPYWPERGAS